MYSKIFNCECTEIQLDTYLQQLMYILGEIIPPKIIKKYIYKPVDMVTTSMDEIAPKLLSCFTIEEMRSTFMNLSPEEQHHIVFEIEYYTLCFNSVPKDANVCVPIKPKDYIKPFFLNLLTPDNILV